MRITRNLATAVKSFFAGTTLQPISFFSDDVSDGLGKTEYRSKTAQLQANLGWVYAANQVISDDCSAVRLKLMRRMPDGDEEEVFQHEILDLIYNPNSIITSKQMWNLYFQYLNLTGEAYIIKLDRQGNPLTDSHKLPTALLPLPSHLCEFRLPTDDDFSHSTVNFAGYDYPITAFLRDTNPDPENIYVGMSIVRKASLTIDTDTEMKRWNNKLFKNGARPGAVLTSPNKLEEKTAKRVLQSFDESYGNVANAFKRILLDDGMEIKPFMMNAQDLDFLESKKFTRDEILAMFRVSPSNLGIVEDVNRANAEAQEYGYAKRCLVPRLKQLCDLLNMRLLYPIYGSEYRIDFDSPVPEDRTLKLNEARDAVNKWLTIDEVRDMYGFDALPDGKGAEIYMPLNNAPISELTDYLPAETEPTSDVGPSGDADEPQDDDEPGDDEKDAPDDAETAQKKRVEIGEAKVKDYTAKSVKYERMIMRLARKMFNEQKADALDWLRNHLDRSWEAKDWAEDMVDWAEYNSVYAEQIKAILQLIVAEIGEEAFNALVEGEFNPYTTEISRYLEVSSSRAITSINEETEKQIRASIAQGLRDDETVQELAARVDEVFGTAGSYRAYRIALTESAMAQNYADVQAWKQTDVVASKEWYTARDEAVCGFCAEQDGKVIGLDEEFYEKGDIIGYEDAKGHTHTMNLNYRDIGEPPLHPQCRCVLLPVLK